MEDGAPSLEVGFAIDTGGSFEALTQLQELMDSTEVKILREAKSIEQATSGMLNVSGATASISAFGNASTKAGADAARAYAQAEKAGEALSRQLDRQTSTFGMTREQVRALKVETAALSAEQQGLTELAGRLRAQQQALADAEANAAAQAQREADAVRQAADAYRTFNAVAAQKMAAYRDQQSADAAQMAAADQLRARINPLAAAQKQYNAEIDSAAKLLAAGKIEQVEHDAQVALSAKTLKAAEKAVEEHTGAMGLNRLQVMEGQSAVIRFSDAVMAGRNPLQAMAVEGHKVVEMMSADDNGMAGGLAKVKALLSPTNLLIAAGAAVLAVAAVEAIKYTEAVAKLGAEAMGTGRLLGLSGEQLEGVAEQAAAAGNMTVGAARDIEMGFLGVARSGDVLQSVTVLTRDYAAATGVDAKQATAELAKVLADPIAGLEEMAEKYGIVTDAQIEHVKQLVEEGNATDAQRAAVEALDPAFAGAADKAQKLGGAWAEIKSEASQAGEMMGWALNKLLAFQNPQFALAQSLAPDMTKPVNPITSRAMADAAQADASARRYQHDNRADFQKQIGLDQRTIAENAGNPAAFASGEMARWTESLAANQHALETWKPAAEKANDIIAANTALRRATTPAAHAAARAQLEQAKAEGEVVTAQNVAIRVQDRLEGYHNRANTAGQKHAETLAREAAAEEAQIKNLFAVADAYGKSGGAALIAEAREKAESKAIKERGDIEAEVNRQVQIAIAQRVANAEKNAAATRDQARIQTEVNGQVAAGNIPAGRANEIVQERIAELPLLQAIEAAQQRGLTADVQKATKALEDQRSAAADAKAAAKGSFYVDAHDAAGRQLDQQREELRLVGATDEVRTRALATLKATQDIEARGFDTTDAYARQQIADQVAIAMGQLAITKAQADYNDALTFTADKWDLIARNVEAAGQGMGDAFGGAGKAIGDLASTYASYRAGQARLDQQHAARVKQFAGQQDALARENTKYALESAGAQIGAYGDMIGAARGFFKEGSAGYNALAAAEKAYRIVQFAFSVAAMIQDVRETISHVTNAAARATANGAEGVSAQAKLPFPLNIVAMAATGAALLAAGIALIGGGGSSGAVAPTKPEDLQKATGISTVLGSQNAQSASIKNSLDLVAKNTSGVLQYSNQMLSSLKSIDASIGALTGTIAKQLNVSGAIGDTSGLNLGSSGSSGFIGLFASSTTRTLYDAGITLAATTVGNIVANGISGQTYQIVEQVKKSSGFLGIGGGTKTTYQTTTGALPSDIAASIQSVIGALENGIVTAAGAIGVSGAKAMLDNFTVSISKLSFNGLDAQGIEDELNAVFSSVGDQMVTAILPDIAKFQKAGEGLFETLERVASTVVAVDSEFKKLGRSAGSIAVDMGVASQFDSVSDFTSAADAYFDKFYTTAEQTAAQLADMQQVFASLNLAMPNSLTGFRQLVDAQDLTTASGQQTYATLLKVAPAFADLEQALTGAKSAADVLSERQDLQNQLWQALGDTADIRAAQLATLDASNRALQEQVWATQDAQELASAWSSVGNTIAEEITKIRGLTTTGTVGFAQAQGQFNAATAAARAGDQDAAKNLPALAESLLTAAAAAATSSQELNRVQAATAASLQQTKSVIDILSGASTTSATTPASNAALLASAATAQATTTPTAANDDLLSAVEDLKAEVAAMRSDNNSALASIAGSASRTAKKLDDVTTASGGDAVAVSFAA